MVGVGLDIGRRKRASLRGSVISFLVYSYIDGIIYYRQDLQ